MGLILDFVIYGYEPSEAAAIAFIVIFGLITAAQSVLVVKSRVWWLSVLVIGGLAQVIGWGGRLWSAIDVYQLDAFLMQQVCLVLGPCFFSAACYGTLGLIINVTNPLASRIRPLYYLIIFCSADLVAVVIQAVGGAMAAISLQNGDVSTTGTNIMVGGIAFQLLSMLVFVAFGFDFWRKERDASRTRHTEGIESSKLRRLSLALVWASFWILVRCVYRVIELAQGWEGYLITTEPYFWGLDTIPMILCQCAFLVAFPAECLPLDRAGDFKDMFAQAQHRVPSQDSSELDEKKV